jgi:DNA-binding response OmpR family regulator
MTAKKISPDENADATSFEQTSDPVRRILVADDDPLICQLNSEVLAGNGYEVDTAGDGADAWNALQLKSYDLLITGHKMPNLTGVELVKKIHAARLALPVIMTSGTMPLEELKRHPELPIEAMLHKPYTLAELLTTVGNVLRVFDRACDPSVPPANWRSLPLPDGLQL